MRFATSSKGGRLLVVQKTGWGKSFVYFIATKLAARSWQRPGAVDLAAAGADAKPDRSGRAHGGSRRHDQLRQPVDEWTQVEAKLRRGKWTSSADLARALGTSASARRFWLASLGRFR
jgi:hypothetical protein